jgi:hypothetical protein
MNSAIVRGSVIAAVAAVLSASSGVSSQVHAQQVSAAAAAADVTPKGEWDAGTAYAVNDLVTARGSSWRSLKASTGKVPGSTSPNNAKYWQLFSRGFNPLGAYSSATTYQPDDLVTSSGSTWRAKKTITNKPPVAGANWEQMAAVGAAGATGATGATGPAGPNTGVGAGSQSVPSISFSGDSNTGLYSPGPDKIALVEGGSLFMHNLGTGNTSLGLGALPSTSTGSQNTALGASALSANTTGAGNVAFGYSALSNSVDGAANIAIGSGALFLNAHGTGNVAVGASALGSFGGNSNVAIGRSALFSNTTGANNVAVGHLALSNSTTADNTAVGYQALMAQSTGFNNTAVGSGALAANTSGTANVAVGRSGLATLQTGSNNIAVGVQALANTDNTCCNIGVGNGALQGNQDGVSNVAVGHEALQNGAHGNNNIAVGQWTLGNTMTGFGNVGVGTGALNNNTTGGFNVAVGNSAGQFASNPSNSIFINNVGASADDNTIKIGTQGTQTTAFIAGIASVQAGDAPVYVDSTTGQLGIGPAPSSRRFKYDIEAMTDMSALLSKLRPVTYRYKQAKSDGTHPLQYGLIAEEVAELNTDLAMFDKDGQPNGVKYHLLPSFLLAGWQAQQNTIAALDAKIDALEKRLRKLEALLPQTKAAALQ